MSAAPINNPDTPLIVNTEIVERVWDEIAGRNFDKFRVEEREVIYDHNPTLRPVYEDVFTTALEQAGNDEAYRAIGGFSVSHRVLRYAAEPAVLPPKTHIDFEDVMWPIYDLRKEAVRAGDFKKASEIVEVEARSRFADTPGIIETLNRLNQIWSRFGASALFLVYEDHLKPRPEPTQGVESDSQA